MDSIKAVKPDTLHVESAIEDHNFNIQVPEELCHLSATQRTSLEKKLVRKLDRRILPITVAMYILNYLDRNNIASARLGGLEADLDLTGSEYQTCVSILFVGYVLLQVPSNLFLNRIGKPAIYLPAAMALWGVISGCAGATSNFGGLLACRFLVGFVEAAFFPGCMFLLSSWYTREELGLRSAVLFIGSLLSGAFSGLIAAGILDGMEGVGGLAGWRWLFILEGLLTVVTSFAAMFVLPNFPHTTSWLSEEEKQMAIWRLNRKGGRGLTNDEEHGLFHGFILAVSDFKTWILLVMIFAEFYSASIINFFPSVVKTLGYDSQVVTLCLTAPPYVLCAITSAFNGWHSDRTKERFLHVSIPLCVAIVAYVLAAATTKAAPRYVAMMLILPGVYSCYPVILSWIVNCIPRPPEKRAAALAFIVAVGNIANIPGSYMYYNGAEPRYIVAFAMSAGAALVAISMALVLRLHLRKINQQLEMNPGTSEFGSGFRYLL